MASTSDITCSADVYLYCLDGRSIGLNLDAIQPSATPRLDQHSVWLMRRKC